MQLYCKSFFPFSDKREFASVVDLRRLGLVERSHLEFVFVSYGIQHNRCRISHKEEVTVNILFRHAMGIGGALRGRRTQLNPHPR